MQKAKIASSVAVVVGTAGSAAAVPTIAALKQLCRREGKKVGCKLFFCGLQIVVYYCMLVVFLVW